MRLEKCINCKPRDHVHSLLHPGQETDYSLMLRFQSRPVQIHPPLNILTLPKWLTVYIPLPPNRIKCQHLK